MEELVPNNVFTRIVDYFIKNHIIDEEDRDIYYYGLRQGSLILLNIIITIIIGFLFDMVLQCILFVVSYIPLRIYGGGYHAKTEGRCFVLSLVLIIVALLTIRIIPITELIILFLVGIGGITVMSLAPIEDRNKPLNQVEERKYRRKISIILIVEVLASISLLILNYMEMALTIAISICILSIMLVLGRLKAKSNID